MKLCFARIVRFFQRPADFVIGPTDNPYLLRWYVIPRNKHFNIYLHNVLRSDDDRALHDHPWKSLSLVLRGRYVEVTSKGQAAKSAGSIIYRSETHSHRLEVYPGETCWTLFCTGPWLREWGFHCPRGWVPWQQFVDQTDHGNVGRGCGEGQGK
jgi:hypothetical protein